LIKALAEEEDRKANESISNSAKISKYYLNLSTSRFLAIIPQKIL